MIITIVIWIVVVSQSKEIRTFNVTLETIVGKDKILISEPLKLIHVQATGNKFDFARLTKNELNIIIDLKI